MPLMLRVVILRTRRLNWGGFRCPLIAQLMAVCRGEGRGNFLVRLFQFSGVFSVVSGSPIFLLRSNTLNHSIGFWILSARLRGAEEQDHPGMDGALTLTIVHTQGRFEIVYPKFGIERRQTWSDASVYCIILCVKKPSPAEHHYTGCMLLLPALIYVWYFQLVWGGFLFLRKGYWHRIHRKPGVFLDRRLHKHTGTCSRSRIQRRNNIKSPS